MKSRILKKRYRDSEGKVGLKFLIITVILVLGVIYLYQINSLVSQSYAMRNCQKEFKDLQDQYKKMEAEIAQLQSLPNLQESIKNLNMSQADNISYLGVGAGKVVVNYPAGQ